MYIPNSKLALRKFRSHASIAWDADYCSWRSHSVGVSDSQSLCLSRWWLFLLFHQMVPHHYYITIVTCWVLVILIFFYCRCTDARNGKRHGVANTKWCWEHAGANRTWFIRGYDCETMQIMNSVLQDILKDKVNWSSFMSFHSAQSCPRKIMNYSS